MPKQLAKLSRARQDSIAYYFAADPRDHGSPRGMMNLMVKIWKNELLSKQNSAYQLDINVSDVGR